MEWRTVGLADTPFFHVLVTIAFILHIHSDSCRAFTPLYFTQLRQWWTNLQVGLPEWPQTMLT